MDKMRMESVDLTAQNIEKIGVLFPNCITETLDENGRLKKSINFELLKQMLSTDVLEGDEAYEFTWVGKKAAVVEANKPIRKTLRPCPDESVNWDTTENLYIEGDNLAALKLLQESYLGSIKMIYIDPPYNTGNDFIYNDDFKISSSDYSEEIGEYDEDGYRLFKNTDSNGRFHSDWASMIYSRLMLSRNLLTHDGVIFISINDKEISGLKDICNEIFGESNFLATLIWDKNHSAQAGIFKVYHEYILVYCKDIMNIKTPKSIEHDLFEAGAMKKVSGRHPASEFTFPAGTRFDAPDGTILEGIYGDTEKVEVTKGRLIAKNGKTLEDVTLKAGFTQANQMKQFFYGDKDSLVDSQGQKIVEFYFNSTGKIKVVKERSVESPQTTCHYGTQGAASTELANLFDLDESPFSSPKPVSMLKDFIIRFMNDGDTILDFFSGSATTAHAVFEANVQNNMKVKYILVQIAEDLDKSLKSAQKDAVRTLQVGIEFLDSIKKKHTICEIGKERIRRAGMKVKGNSSITTMDLDVGFRVLKLDDSNMTDVYYSPAEYSQDLLLMLESNVKSDRNDLDLLFGCLLEWGLPLSLPYSSEQIDGCTVHNYNDGDLIACFDKDVPDSVIKEIAKRQPLRAVFRDSSFANSPSKINVGEIFKMLAPDTRVKVI
jgi:DNA (cytosine-5-)-methyltransferase